MFIKKVRIRNFKSIRSLDLNLDSLNVLIGPNGAGKSNFISFFKFLNTIINKELQKKVAAQQGADNLLYFGRKTSDHIIFKIRFQTIEGYFNTYECKLAPNQANSFFFEEEKIAFIRNVREYPESYGTGHLETNMPLAVNYGKSSYVVWAFKSFRVYHFHDTSESAPVKQMCNTNDAHYLKEDGSNLAAMLFLMMNKHPGEFRQIESTIKSVAPFFKGFDLKPSAANPNLIQLEWKEVGTDKYFNAHNLSDGTIRMICLATVLLQPKPPDSIIIDEPELGLHPFAINKLASLIKSASEKSQIIISTQSVTLLNHFEPENIIVVDREDGQTTFKRIERSSLGDWVNDFSIGDMWEKNVFGGRP